MGVFRNILYNTCNFKNLSPAILNGLPYNTLVLPKIFFGHGLCQNYGIWLL